MAEDPLVAFLAAECGRPLPPALMAAATAARDRFGQGVLAVIVYGSCLRDGEDRGRLVDLYVLVDRLASVHRSPLMRLLNHLVPPNVYYQECRHEERVVRAKVALLTLDQLEAGVSATTDNPYFWARFSQPTAIAWIADAEARARVHTLLAQAVRTSLGHALSIEPGAPADLSLWVRLFAETYRTELRAEPPSRANELVQADQERYAKILTLAAPAALPGGGWGRRRILGKLWSVARLIKAGYTFQGGADYLAYKIERHSGVVIELTDWERRHPVLAGLCLFWRYRRRGAFR